MAKHLVRSRSLLTASAALIATPLWTASAYAQATPDTLVSVCSGVMLPRSEITDLLGPIVTGIYGPIEGNNNQTLGVLGGLLGLPGPLSVDVSTLLSDAGSGSDIGLGVINDNGTQADPADECDAHADSFSLDNPTGISIGGNVIDGLGASSGSRSPRAGSTGRSAVAGKVPGSAEQC